jgi:hypothetical protein
MWAVPAPMTSGTPLLNSAPAAVEQVERGDNNYKHNAE